MDIDRSIVQPAIAYLVPVRSITEIQLALAGQLDDDGLREKKDRKIHRRKVLNILIS